MTKSMTAHRIMAVLTLLVLVSSGALAQSDSASRPPAPATAAADKQAAKQTRRNPAKAREPCIPIAPT